VTGPARPTRGSAPRRARRTGDLLSRRALNRALLERQHLLRRSTLSIPQMIEHLVGMQAQVPNNPYVGLWTRLLRFHTDDLSQLILDRRAVRIGVMRATIHLLTADDCVALRQLMQPVLSRALYGNSAFRRAVAAVDVDELTGLGRRLLEEQPRPLAALRELLHERWPDNDATSLAAAVHFLLPLVQVPPRGVWGASHQPTCTTAEHWLGGPLATDTTPDALILRYLAAFGPATVADARNWCRLTGLGLAFERLRPQLRTFQDEHGRELFDLPDAPLPDPETPVPPRFLPEYDNVFLGHEDRARIVTEADHQWASTEIGNGTVLVDGFIGATWRLKRERDAASLTITVKSTSSRSDQTSTAEEAERFLAFVAADAKSRDVQLRLPS
jgi:hypothetical protein